MLICDEAHRIRETSASRFTRRTIARTPQVDELLAAAKVSVFFIDDLQIVRPGEVGSSELIRQTAADPQIPVIEHTLEAQFRCGGSDAFVGGSTTPSTSAAPRTSCGTRRGVRLRRRRLAPKSSRR